jgi:hypothetical protein
VGDIIEEFRDLDKLG